MKKLYLIVSLLAYSLSLSATHTPNHYKLTNASELNNLIGKGKPAMVYFSSLTCGPCKTVHPIFEGIIQANAQNNILFIEIIEGVTSNASQLYNQYGVRGFPNFVFFDQNGTKVSSFSGYSDDVKAKMELNITKISSPAAPSNQPVHANIPANQPVKPVMQPNQPNVQPSMPAQPTQAKTMPALPAKQPDMIKPIAQKMQPGAPVAQPSMPIKQPAMPALKSAPIAKPQPQKHMKQARSSTRALCAKGNRRIQIR